MGRFVLLVAVSLSFASKSQADQLHVYGPPGSAVERRVLVVAERGDGSCVAPDAPDLAIAVVDGVAAITREGSAGPCAQWVRVTAAAPLSRVTLAATADEYEARVAVPFATSDQLEVTAVREGRTLTVTVQGAAPGEALTGTAYVEGAALALEPTGAGDLVGDVPESGLIGVVVRSATMMGAAVLAPRATGEPRALIMPAHLSIEAGGSPREVAFVAVVDRRGRLTRRLHISIQSDRGRLRSFRWVRTGLAAVTLSAPGGLDSIDLAVRLDRVALAEAELDVIADWPVAGELRGPASAQSGATFEIDAEARAADGSPIPAGRLAIRCGGGEVAAVPARCAAASASERVIVALLATIDGRQVPLATRTIDVRPPTPREEPPPDSSVTAEPVVAAPPDPPSAAVHLVAFARGALDSWGGPSAGGGARIVVPVIEALRIGGGVEYAASGLAISSADNAVRLDGIRHLLIGTAAGELVFGGEFGGALRLEVGVGWAHAEGRIGDADATGESLHVTALLAAGPRISLSRWELGLDVGVRAGTDVDGRAWDSAPVAGFVEVNGALGIP